MKISHFAVLVTVLATVAIQGCSGVSAAQSGQGCSIDPVQVSRSPINLDGSVVGLISREQAKIATEQVEKQTGVQISPDYADLPRVVVRVVRKQTISDTLAAVVDGHIPHLGDHVEFLSRYQDPRSRCSFIPWTVGSGPATS